MLLSPRRRVDGAPGMRGAVSRSAPATLCADTGHIPVVVGEPDDHVVGYPARGGVRRPKSVRLGTPGRPVRTGRSGNKVSRTRRALDAGGSVKPLVSHVLRLRCAARRARPTSPRADPPFRPSTCSAARRDTQDLRSDAAVSTSWASLHCTKTVVIMCECAVALKRVQKYTRSRGVGTGAPARHGGPSIGLDLELHIGVLGRPGAVRGVAGLEV